MSFIDAHGFVSRLFQRIEQARAAALAVGTSKNAISQGNVNAIRPISNSPNEENVTDESVTLPPPPGFE